MQINILCHFNNMFIIYLMAFLFKIHAFNIASPITEETREENNYVVSLYDNSPHVIEFNDRNFGEQIFGNYSKIAHFIEFYASWCGHCQKFAPIWSKLAWTTRKWHKVAVVGAVNCALKENELLCLRNNVTYYPQTKYFPRSAKSANDGILLQSSHSVVKIKRNLINMTVEDYATGNYEDWPNFNYLPDTHDINLLGLGNITHSGKSQYIGLVFEDENDKFIGIEIMLDFLDVIEVRRVAYSNPLTFVFDIETFPTFVLLERSNNTVLYKSDFRTAFMDDIGRFLVASGKYATSSLQFTSSTTSPSTTTLSNEQLKTKFVLTETDLLLTAKHSLLDAVTSGYLEIGASKSKHLQNFVNLLRLYFPPISNSVQQTLRGFGINFPQSLERSKRAKALFNDLHLYLNQLGNRTIKREEWIEKFQELEGKHGKPFPENSQFVHCKGSKPVFRGYTCGLWTMFHTLTVNAFYERGFQPNFDPLSLLKSIQGYVENFFGCTDCATHFVDMVTRSFKMEHFVHNAADVVLYLWQAHNIVNYRLSQTNTEDPTMPKVQFPPIFLCPHCRHSTSGRWEENAVLHFLTRYYGSDIAAHVEHQY